MNPSNKLLSDLIAFRTYAKYIPHMERRETLEETINRNMIMHLDRFPNLSRDITKAFTLVHELRIMPSMRAMQFSGGAILKNNARQYNCSYTPIDKVRKFGEILFLLLSGTGVGFSVQKRHIDQLPKVGVPAEEGVFYVQDSILGWAQSVDLLMNAYFYNGVRPLFNFQNIRPKGSPLHTTGAKAPGPEPLKYMLEVLENTLKLSTGRKLKSLEVHDIICIISDCVLAGGIRRAALISLFDRDDRAMLKCKTGKWYEQHPYRARANNSAVLPRTEVTKEEFYSIFKMCQDSGAGEPGFSWTNDPDQGFNPCHEIALRPDQFCNLTTVNQTGIKNKKDFLNRVYSAALIGTLQAAYTDFPYLSPEWKRTTEQEALLGVSFTGIADAGNIITADWLEEGARLVLEVNEKYARKIGINVAARATAVKPEGSASCVLGSSSGIHDRKGKNYIRRFQINKDDALYHYLKFAIPGLVEDAKGVPNTAVVSIPQESPEGAILESDETAMDLFERAIKYNKFWVNPGHRSGVNKHNVSCTVTAKPDEWDDLCEAMWKQRAHYSGISLFPHDNGSYEQAPFEICTKEKYEEMNKQVGDIDFKLVKEFENNTNLIETVACAGNACEIKW